MKATGEARQNILGCCDDKHLPVQVSPEFISEKYVESFGLAVLGSKVPVVIRVVAKKQTLSLMLVFKVGQLLENLIFFC